MFKKNIKQTRSDHLKMKGRYARHDNYYHEAKKMGFVARSVFKLEEIDNDFSLFRPGDWVLDLGCAPGSWLQYAESKVAQMGGRLVGIDLLPAKVSFGQHVHIIQGDIFEVVEADLLPKHIDGLSKNQFDVVLSDMAPNTTGIRSVDQDRSLVLCERALDVALKILRPGGRFCVKILEGGGIKDYLALCRKHFDSVKIRRPKSTRATSMETYVICLQKKANL